MEGEKKNVVLYKISYFVPEKVSGTNYKFNKNKSIDLEFFRGHVFNYSFTNNKTTFFKPEGSTGLGNAFTVSPKPGTVYRNNVWFYADEESDELCKKAIDLFKKAKTKEILKARHKLATLDNDLHGLNELLKLY